MRHLVLSICMSLVYCTTSAQATLAPQQISAKADSLYSAKNYIAAADMYLQHIAVVEFKAFKRSSFYNAACCFALAGKTAQAIIALQSAIALGYNNKAHLLEDSDLLSLHKEPVWQVLIDSIVDTKAVNTDPAKAKFVTDDIHHFWKAYELAQKDTANFVNIIKANYFDQSSIGMDDYMALKVSSIESFVQHIRSAPKFYSAIEKNTLKVDAYKKDFRRSFIKFKKIYPAATFPDVYFVIGSFTSGGTVSDAGLLIGLNQAAQSDDTPVDELSFRQRTRLNEIKYMPSVIAHELIHFQQKGMASDTNTLKYVIVEGMADFMGELINGSTANPKLYAWAKGKEKAIWEKFTKDMYQNKYNNWIANSVQATPDNLPDQGYWLGYQICKAYYEKASDKKKAIDDMLHIQDYKLFLEQSGWEKKLEALQ